MKVILKLLCSTAFMMGLALAVSLITNYGGLFPGDVLTSDRRSNITILVLAVMMTITLSRIPYRNLNPIEHRRSVARAVLLGIVLAGIIPLAAYYILDGTEAYGRYAEGLVFIAAAPFAASVGPLSLILRGDLEHALRSTIIVYVVDLVWIPFIMFWYRTSLSVVSPASPLVTFQST